MVLIRGRRCETNLYVLQVEGGCLGHMDDCKSHKKVTFDNGKGIGLEGEIVESKPNSHEVGDGFDHLIMHALSCTIKSEDESVTGYRSICFGSLNEVMDEDDLVCLNVEKTRRSEAQTDCSTGRAYVARSSKSTIARP